MDAIMKRALALTKLKYGSQANAIMQAIAEAGAIRKSQVSQARAGAKYGTDAERYGQVGINKAFDGIRDAAAQSGAYMDKLSPVAQGTPGSALLAAIQNSRQNMPQNVANQRALAIQDSESRAARARSGGAFAEQAANATFQGNVAKLRDQLSQIQDKAATSTETTYQSLLDDYNKEQRLLGDSAERARHNRAMENKKGAGKGKWLTQSQQNAFNEKVSQAYGWVQRLAGSGASGKQVRQLLSAGGSTPRGQYKDPATGTMKSVAGEKVPNYGTDVARIAMDLYYNVRPGSRPGQRQGTLTATSKRIYRSRRVKPPKAWVG